MSVEETLAWHRRIIEVCLRLEVGFWWRDRGTFLISGEGAQRVVTELVAQGERVIGLDGFELESYFISPRLDRIFDADRAPASDPVAVLGSWDERMWVHVQLARTPGPVAEA